MQFYEKSFVVALRVIEPILATVVESLLGLFQISLATVSHYPNYLLLPLVSKGLQAADSPGIFQSFLSTHTLRALRLVRISLPRRSNFFHYQNLRAYMFYARHYPKKIPTVCISHR